MTREAEAVSPGIEALPGPLIATKLHAPIPRELVPRPWLIAALAGTTRLALVRAPAGWGKSSLIAAWSQSATEDRPFAWLALDADDDEPTRFWLHVIAALRTVEPSIGTSALAFLSVPGTDVVADVLPPLLNALAELRADVVLVLDDYHVLRRPEIHDQVSFFVEHLPAALKLVLVSREQPPLPLARLRARGDLVELDVDRLRFDETEADELLNGLLELGLGPAQVAKLAERTEGWAAGLYLAALSLEGAGDRSSFIERFAGDDRHIVDYLGAEVLAAQPEPVRHFLLRTSILDRFCAPLAAAVAQMQEAAALLPQIERSNLFLVSLDSRREWYRYHHLFGQLLRVELELAEVDAIPDLHRRAARWHLDAGLVSEGISHTIAAGDLQEAGGLIAGHWAIALLGTAGDRTIGRWLAALPPDAIAGDLRLCVAQCFVGLSLGRMDDVAHWLAIAEEAPLPGPFLDGLTSERGALACVRAGYLWETGDAAGADAAGREVLDAESGPWQAIGAAVIGLAHAARAEWHEGTKWSLEYARYGREGGHTLNEVSGLSTAAACDAEAGEWERAGERAERALELARANGIDEHWCTAEAHLARGMLLERAGDLDGAAAAFERAIELARRGAGPVSTAWPLLHLARARAALGDRKAALAGLDDGEAALVQARDPGTVAERLAAERRRLARIRRDDAGLTARELDVLRLLASPRSQREIAAELYVSLNTVKAHTKSIFRKLDVSGREQAVAGAREAGLI